MARVTVQNGEVVRHLGQKGYVIQTQYTTRNNETRKESWTVWGEQPALGAIVTVTGNITVKLDEWESDEGKRQVARGHINNPDVVYSPVQKDLMQSVEQPLSFDPQVPF
jgi:hypothetical protein